MDICTVDDIGMSITGKDAQPVIDALNEYLKVFAKPVKRDGDGVATGSHSCLQCGEPINGLLGTFTYGIATGEGNCGRCGWPARAQHVPKMDGEPLFNRPVEIVLMYHPTAA